MKNKKLKIFGVCITMFLAALIVVKITNYPVFAQSFGVSLVNEYSKLSDLENDSSEIVDATVIESEYFMYEDVPFTLTKVKINKVHKGKFNKGDIVNVLETGGVIDNVAYTVENDELMKKNESAVLYLYKYEGPIKEDVEKYVVSGLHQGKFKYDKAQKTVKSNEHKFGELSNVDSLEDLNLNEK